MSHIREGTLQAYLDGELAPDLRERIHQHLERCTRCLARLAALSGERHWIGDQIASTAPGALEAPRPQRALTKIYKQQDGGIETMFSKLTKRQRRALVGVLAVLMIVGSLTFAPVRAWASEFLGIFRVERFVVVNADQERFEELEDVLSEEDFMGEFEIIQDPGEPYEVASLAEAAEVVGFEPRTIEGADYAAPRIDVMGQGMVNVTPDVEMIRGVFEAMELDPSLIPDNVDGQPFTITLPATVVQTWEREDRQPVTLVQAVSPEVDIPNDVDVEALGEAMLQLFGMTPEEAERLSQTIDWTTTLVMPIPQDLANVQEISVDGVTGLLFTSRWQEQDGDEYHHRNVALLWQHGGVVTVLQGSDDEQVLDLVNSLR